MLEALAVKAANIDPTYANKAVAAMNAIAGNTAVTSQLAPVVSAGVQLVQVAYKEISSSVASAATGPSFVTKIEGMALSLANDVLNLSEEEAAGAAQLAADVGGAIADAIPIIGMVVSMFENASTLLGQEQDANIQQQIQNCTNFFRPVVGTGAGGSTKPADIFVAGYTKAVAPTYVTGPSGKQVQLTAGSAALPYPSSVGAALIALTECAASGGGAPGIPATTRALFTMLRLAIEASALDPAKTDGGAQVWPVYIDLLRSEFDSGHITPAYAMSLWHTAFPARFGGFSLPTPVNDDAGIPALPPGPCAFTVVPWSPPDPTTVAGLIKAACSKYSAAACSTQVDCRDIDQRPILSVVAMVNSWRDTIMPNHVPKWGSDIIALQTEQTFVAEATRLAKQELTGVQTAPPPVAAPAVVITKVAPKTPAVVAVLLGAAAIGGVFMASRVLARRAARVAAR
jgi:hypothetical protein